MRNAYLFIWALTCLSGCASTPQYSIGELDAQDRQDMELSKPEPIHGRWLSADTLEVTLIYGVPADAILPIKSLKAEVVRDVVQLHLILENDRSRDPNAPIPLCVDEKRLTYILHGLKRQSYQVQLLENLYGHDYAWDIRPLRIRE